MANENELLEMLRKMSDNIGHSEETQKKAQDVLNVMMDDEAKAAQHDALIRQSFLSVMMYCLGIIGTKNLDGAAEAVGHLRKCMDLVIANRGGLEKAAGKIPGANLLHTMRPVISEADDV